MIVRTAPPVANQGVNGASTWSRVPVGKVDWTMRGTRFAFLAVLGLAAGVQMGGCSCDPRGPGAPSDERVVALPLPGQECQQELLGNGGFWELEQVGSRGERPRVQRTLDRLCTYRWIGRTAGAPLDLRSFAPSVFEAASEQREVVRVLGPASTRLTGLLDLALVNLDTQAEATPLGSAPGDHRQVWVGFPDTAAAPASGAADTIPLGAGGNAHAFNIAWINRHLTCPSGDRCLTTPRFELAIENGDRGTVKVFAEAIRKLVDRWARAGKPSGHPLILNIAAGWEPAQECLLRLPQFGGARAATSGKSGDRGWREGGIEKPTTPVDVASELRPGEDPRPGSAKGPPGGKSERDKHTGRILDARSTVPFADATPECASGSAALNADALAVLEELEAAACQGALLVAAAGNNPLVSPQRRGPMLPAAWETLPAPDAARCGELLGPTAVLPSNAPAGAYRPLVYAAGGVNDNDSPIVLTREDGLARVVAPASLLAAFPANRSEAGYAAVCGIGTAGGLCDHTYPMTGTSVAAAVVSAAAAAVWAYQPTWDAHQVMDAVYASGAALDPVQASFSQGATSLGTSAERVHRVSICRAAQLSLGARTPSVSLACAGGDATRPFDGLPKPEPYFTALTGTLPVSLTSEHGQVDPQPGWPCPECFTTLNTEPEEPWEIQGEIPYDAWSALGANEIRVSGDTGTTPSFSSSLQVTLLDANGRVLGIAGDNQSGFSSSAAITGYPVNGSWTMPLTNQSALPVYGSFVPADQNARLVAHVVVQFQKRSATNPSWSSAAEEITIVVPR